MPTINIKVLNKKAFQTNKEVIVCGNSDYTIVFDFDSEWASYSTKTARFVTEDGYQEVVFTGNSCAAPMINNVLGVRIGVCTGTSVSTAQLHTTTPAYVDCVKSILCGSGPHITPTADVYAQIIALLNGFSANVSKTGNKATITIVDPEGTTTAEITDGEDGEDGQDGYSPTLAVTDITGGHRITITDKNGTRTVDVMDGEPGTTDWNGIENKPEVFPPSSHTHDDRYFTESEVNAMIALITALIPSQATAQNQLADKSFVNSTIATNTANYIYKTVGTEKVPFDSVAELEAYTGTVTHNDYAFVTGTDSEGNAYYDRYKATVIGSTVTWAKEFRLNNSSFTAVQWAAITSGITAALVASYNAHLSNTDNHITASERTTWNGKAEDSAVIKGVQVAGTDLAKDSDGKVNVPLISGATAGVAKVSTSLGTSSGNGFISIQRASDADIDTRTSLYKPIVPINLDYAHKSAKQALCKTTLPSVFVSGESYYLGEQTTVSVVLPSTATAGDMITVVFYSGATATTLSISGSYLGTLPTPSTNQRVELNLLYDGTNWTLLSNVMATS